MLLHGHLLLLQLLPAVPGLYCRWRTVLLLLWVHKALLRGSIGLLLLLLPPCGIHAPPALLRRHHRLLRGHTPPCGRKAVGGLRLPQQPGSGARGSPCCPLLLQWGREAASSSSRRERAPVGAPACRLQLRRTAVRAGLPGWIRTQWYPPVGGRQGPACLPLLRVGNRLLLLLRVGALMAVGAVLPSCS